MDLLARKRVLERTIEDLQALWDKADDRNDFIMCYTLTEQIKKHQETIKQIDVLLNFKGE